jgi:polyribonucleotide nucleotidyltransferase
VLVSYGDTIVLCTAVGVRTAKPGQDFFPLTVNYQEKAFAAGKIPGGFFKREGRPSEKETLVSRLIDRPIRPLFPGGLPQRGAGRRHRAEPRSGERSRHRRADRLLGRADLSGIPFFGPVAAARVGYIDGEVHPEPDPRRRPRPAARPGRRRHRRGRADGRSEAKELSEDVMLGAVTFGHTAFQPVIQAIIELAEHAAKEPWPLPSPPRPSEGARRRLDALGRAADRRGLQEKVKQARYDEGVGAAKKAADAALPPRAWTPTRPRPMFKDLEADIVRNAILDTGLRIDGRDTKTVRPIVAEVGILPRAHGSALFTRGETQALCVATLGTGQDEQIIDALEGEYRENFMLHYNFPPYSVGEAGRMGSPGRREIGHGKLAWRACTRCCRRRTSSRTRCAWSPRSPRATAQLLDGDGVRRLAGADGCRRAAEAPGGGHRHGPDQGRHAASPCCPTSWATRITSATWISRSPAPTRASPACRWTSRSPPSRRRS